MFLVVEADDKNGSGSKHHEPRKSYAGGGHGHGMLDAQPKVTDPADAAAGTTTGQETDRPDLNGGSGESGPDGGAGGDAGIVGGKEGADGVGNAEGASGDDAVAGRGEEMLGSGGEGPGGIGGIHGVMAEMEDKAEEVKQE